MLGWIVAYLFIGTLLAEVNVWGARQRGMYPTALNYGVVFALWPVVVAVLIFRR